MKQIKRAKTLVFRSARKIRSHLMRKRAQLLKLGHTNVEVVFKRIVKLAKYELGIRPRARVLLKVLGVLILLFAVSSEAVAYIKPKEAQVKVNGQAILVSDKPVPTPIPFVISQSVSGIRSPFFSEKPIDGPISQGFTRYHRGLDITSPLGTPIRPVGPGIVRFAGYNPDGHGNEVIVDHGDGLQSSYAHMGKIHVGSGNMVSSDTVIGTVGMTGRTTGPHVHFEVLEDGVAVNPLNLLP